MADWKRNCNKQIGFPRKIVISPGYGAGIASWADDELGYEVVENPAFVEYVENGGRDEDEARAILEAEGILKPDDYFYFGGLRTAEVVEVHGPYRITDYDGYESIETLDADVWRT